VSVFDTPFLGVDGWLKRLEDLAIGIVAVILTAPLMLAIAAGVKLSSPGPVLFRQHRYGLSGKVVEVWKFRTSSNLIFRVSRNSSARLKEVPIPHLKTGQVTCY